MKTETNYFVHLKNSPAAWLIFFLLIFTISCNQIPNYTYSFEEDSAYNFIKKQVNFGPRVPNTLAHDSCAIYLEQKLTSFGAKVFVQKAQVLRFDNKKLYISNIIARFFPDKKRRILLFAHWDSRFYADGEKDSLKRQIPIDGANDGASGVAVLLEIARQISINNPKIGVDIIFFDAEDQGLPIDSKIYKEKSWSLGAQYWTKNISKNEFNDFVGINLDMVASENAVFAQEDNSRYFDNFQVKQIWDLAKKLGYEKYFVKSFSQPLLDDHVFVSQDAAIRSILIVDNKPNSQNIFFEYWHTHNDNLQNVNKKTLKAVGDVVLNYIYLQK